MSITVLGLGAEKTLAQSIIPSTQSDNSIYYYGSGSGSKISMNCDMLDFGNGRSVKAITWGNSSGQVDLYVEDYNGNVDWATHSSPSTTSGGCYEPDVVLGVRHNYTTFQDEYRLGLIYRVRQTSGVNVYYEVELTVYDLTNLGTGSFAITPSGQYTLSAPNTTCDGFPHIDMMPELDSTMFGFPMLNDFAAVWSNNGSLEMVGARLSDPSPSGSSFWFSPMVPRDTTQGTVCNYPDVAGSHDRLTGKHWYVVYQIIPGGSPTPDLVVWESGAGGPGTNYTIDNSVDVFSPRIEAMGTTNFPVTSHAKWQVVACTSPMNSNSPYSAWGYNDLSGSPTLLSNLFNNTIDVKAPVVAAGVGPYWTVPGQSIPSNIGNQQYTVGFNPHDAAYPTNFPYARSVVASSGAVTDPDTYEVPNSSSYGYYVEYDARNFAMSSCSNSGRDILSAWFMPGYIGYKISPNAMSFKNAGTSNELSNERLIAIGSVKNSSSKSEKINTMSAFVYPNPASQTMSLVNAKGSNYQIFDVCGKLVLEGSASDDIARVDVSRLTDGAYTLKTSKLGEACNRFSFIKN